MHRRAVLRTLAASSLVALIPDSLAAETSRTIVRPREIDDLLANPGMGWQTFHQFADRDRNLRGLPSSSAYFRFYWREIEPEEGKPDFAKLDALLVHAKRVGQKLALRIMVTGSGEYSDCPDWLRELGCKGTVARYGGAEHWVPDLSDPVFQTAHFRLIRALGQRYDGHPDLDLIDVGTVGLWGEWHLSDVVDVATGAEVPMPSEAVQNEIVDEWIAAFPRTPKVVLIGGDVAMARAAKAKLGWRADCFGDLGMFTPNWNHMRHFYPRQVETHGAGDVWKSAPVAFESCGDLREWTRRGWSLREIFDYGLAMHASYLNNKSAPLPDDALPEVERFLKKLGYRLVLRSLEHDAVVSRGAPFAMKTTWENVGVAPPYRDDRLALRLRPAADDQAKPIVVVSDVSIRGWLPGEKVVETSFTLPADLPRGKYEVAIGVVEASSNRPVVRLAIEGRDGQGWYALSEMEVF